LRVPPVSIRRTHPLGSSPGAVAWACRKAACGDRLARALIMRLPMLGLRPRGHQAPAEAPELTASVSRSVSPPGLPARPIVSGAVSRVSCGGRDLADADGCAETEANRTSPGAVSFLMHSQSTRHQPIIAPLENPAATIRRTPTDNASARGLRSDRSVTLRANAGLIHVLRKALTMAFECR